MRRGRTLILVLLLVVIVLAGGFFAFTQLTKKTPKPAEVVKPTTVKIYIAEQPIPQGVAVTEAVLGTIDLPPENVRGIMYEVGEKDMLVGKIAKLNIEPGTPIMESMVSDSVVPITGPSWATKIPIGMTAISIPISKLSVAAYSINEGAHVNVNGCFAFVDIDPAFQTVLPNLTASLSSTGFLPDTLTALTLGVDSAKGGQQGRVELDPSLQQPYYLIPSEKVQRPRVTCQTVMQDVVVMKLGDFSLTDTGSASKTAAATPQPQQQQQQQQQQQPPSPPDIVTLIVTPQDAIILTYLMYSDAQITMTLRNPGDQARQATEAATLQFLLSQYNIPIPAKLPYSMEVNFDPTAAGLSVTTPPNVPAP
ncbi:MAG: RcpC/CpaB family pilus assembly protein [Anaerolineales bacterium]|nr:RcpC/CpaB family pilus assembly protein [Anaerolineales bacterium]